MTIFKLNIMIHGNSKQRNINSFEFVACPRPRDIFQKRRFDDSSKQNYTATAEEFDAYYVKPPSSVLDALELSRRLDEIDKHDD